jgi:hypothetical protein
METTTGQTATMSQWTAPAAAVEIDLARVRAAIPRVAGQVNELIRSMPDVTIPIPGSAWSVGDAAAHLVVVFRAFTDAMEGRLEYWDARYGEGDIRTWARLAEGNARPGARYRTAMTLMPWLGSCARGYRRFSPPRPSVRRITPSAPRGMARTAHATPADPKRGPGRDCFCLLQEARPKTTGPATT